MTASTFPKLTLEADTSWHAEANCNSVTPEVARRFFSDDLSDIGDAKRICATCPVIVDCLDTALGRGEQWGIWGGQLFVSGKIVMTKRRRGRPPKVARAEDQMPQIPLPEHLRHLQPALA